MKKNIVKSVLLGLLSLYLVASACYIFSYIEFEPEDPYVGGLPSFVPGSNIKRVLMGLPPSYTSEKEVSPIHLIRVVLRIVLALIVVYYIIKMWKKDSKKD